MSASQSAANEVEAAATLDSIALNPDIWNDCDLGTVQEWPEALQKAAAFALTLSYPAAIYWGPKLVMIYNEAWKGIARGKPKQGKPPNEYYAESTKNALRANFEGRICPVLASSDLVEDGSKSPNEHPVLCSPIRDGDKVEGCLVQIFCKTQPTQQSQPREKQSKEEGQREDSSKDMARFIHTENTALDKQPFFQSFSEMLPTGLAILNHKAEPLFVNRQFYDLTAHRGPDQSFRMWPETIHPDDYDRVMEEYHHSFERQSQLSTEFRAFGENQWRLFMMRPLGNAILQQHFGGFICALIDITSIKIAELTQTRIAKEAEERKVQQERFIDMISHEIRNPLSAILHCAEDILDAVQNGKAKSDNIPVDDIVEATNTISLCVAHQKNLVDDVLSFSKLDASMLTLSPKATKPKLQLADTLRIFQPELRKLKIEFGFAVDPTYNECKVEWVQADLVRISQVLVNLMTNAIKFTSKTEHKKTIQVQVAATIERPDSYPPNIVFFDTEDRHLKDDATNNPEWGNGDPLFIMVAVKDTGIGINKENQTRLFQRFKQATPRTEQTYGGSGLGLNIARKLCQLHGGEIGVSSSEDEGSTFGFFFRVRRTDEPDDEGKMKPEDLSSRLQTSGHMDPSQVNDKDVPEDLKKKQNEQTLGNISDEIPKDRWEGTAEIAHHLKESDAQDKSDQHEKAHETKTRVSENTGKEDSKSKPRVLFVEDNIINQKILKRKIEAKGFDVTTADNGQEAVNLVHENSKGNNPAFDCILMDQEMPVMDGNTASKEIRKFEDEHSMPPTNIIGVSANVREEQQKNMTDAGMNDVIGKPFKMDDLLYKMRRGSTS